MATHNRREVVVGTLRRLAACGLSRAEYEIIVVDNASTDGTPDATAGEVDTLLRLSRNAGSCAKAFGVDLDVGQVMVQDAERLGWKRALSALRDVDQVASPGL